MIHTDGNPTIASQRSTVQAATASHEGQTGRSEGNPARAKRTYLPFAGFRSMLPRRFPSLGTWSVRPVA